MSATERTKLDFVASVCQRLSLTTLLSLAILELIAAEPSASLASTTPATNSVVVPFDFRRGHVMVPARVNGSNSLSLLLDTGYTMTMLHSEHIETFGLKRVGRTTIVGIAGEVMAG